MRPRPAPLRRTLAAVTAIAVVFAGQSVPGSAVPPPSADSPQGTATEAPQVRRVTLVTGDVAELETRPDGTERARLADGGSYHAFVQDGDAYVVPAVAQPLLGHDLLDLALFDVSSLVRQGYDDQHTARIPLILSYSGRTGFAATKAPAGSTRSAVLGSVNAMAVKTAKKDARTFWNGIAAASAPAKAPKLIGGVGKVWLDAKVHSTLDQSAGQIGAPAAWARGYTGKNTTVAVLDTGIDDTHPDFAGRIGLTQDFTGTGTVHDGAGHGTHVASIAAGTGAASDGTYRGIASDATLMIGKVLGDDGTGDSSTLIAGMEWAAANGADIVNISIGGPVTRGDDPMSKAVDQLTAQYNTLFVVAAGNKDPWIPGMNAVTAPGSAAAALTVGATNQPTAMWGSSRHGRMDGDAIKPDIVAPGVNITAAGSSYAGLPSYINATGTSMATPHVAGAAALLKQEHPAWGAKELRDALTSTTKPVNSDVYTRGAGLVDVDRATAQQVYVDSGTLHLGYFARPFEPGELTTSRTLTYRNTTSTDVTLDLTTELTGKQSDTAPADVLTAEPATLTVPAGGMAQATVRLDATDAAADTYSGRVTARSGKLEIGTTVGFYKQDDTADVTFRATGRDGKPATATIRVSPYRERDGRYFPDYIYLDEQQPEYTVRLPEGDYNLWSMVSTFDESGRYIEQQSMVGDPKLEVHTNADVTLDARTAVPIKLDTPRPSEPRSLSLNWWRGDDDSSLFTEDTWSWSFTDGSPEQVSVTPTERVTDAPFVFSSSWDSGVAPLDVRSAGKRLDAVQVAGPILDGRQTLPVATTGDVRDRAALIEESADLDERIAAAATAGAKVAVLWSPQPGVFWPNTLSAPIPVLALPRSQAQSLRGPLWLEGTPRTPYAYDVSFTESGEVPSELTYRPRQQDLAEVTANVYTTGTNERGWRLHQASADSCDCGPGIVDDFVPSTGYTRTEYVTAQPGVQVTSAWRFLFNLPGDILYDRSNKTYEPGQKVSENWLKAPLSPGLPQSDINVGGRRAVTRSGDWLSYSLAGFTDSDGHWLPNFSVMTESSRLYRDGQQVYASQGLIGGANMPADQATYRLEADVRHDGSRIGLSTNTHTAWRFTSAMTSGEQMLPLIDLDYADLVDAHSGHDALDLANTARGDRSVRLVVAAAHQQGSEAASVSSARVQVSYDDGATWADAAVQAIGGDRFAATYRQPEASATTGYVSLRVEATDGDGNSVDQTLIRAYRLR